ncbi:MAG: cysteine hydrolase [Planctomycetaceae bacterium]|jgi:nicotinamidase-related amidase|nr:cysteine hydrolase [Planctomycetaceae bacterium]
MKIGRLCFGKTNFGFVLMFFVGLLPMFFGIGQEMLLAEELLTIVTQDRVVAKSPTKIGEKSTVSSVRQTVEQWKPSETAVIICDMWTQHGCSHATERLTELAVPMNEVISKARERGVLIIHAPSGGMDKYDVNLPARKTAEKFRKDMGNPRHWDFWEHSSPAEQDIPFPVDAPHGGCSSPTCKDGSKANFKEIDILTIKDNDVLTDDFVEVKDYLKHKGIKNVIIMGVHTNMCIIGRPFGLRAMKKDGFHTVLMRDMTDLMYNNTLGNEDEPPFVNHFLGLDMVIEHIEAYICPTILSSDFTGKKRFRFKEDKRYSNNSKL